MAYTLWSNNCLIRASQRPMWSNPCHECDWTPPHMKFKSPHVKARGEDEERIYTVVTQMDSRQPALPGTI